MSRTFHFRNCDVVVDDDRRRVETRFKSGAVAVATPQMDPESIARSRSLGYHGSDEFRVWQMTRDHDLLHTTLAEAMGQPFSPTLHAVAHGYDVAPKAVDREERLVLFMQRLLHQGLTRVAGEEP